MPSKRRNSRKRKYTRKLVKLSRPIYFSISSLLLFVTLVQILWVASRVETRSLLAAVLLAVFGVVILRLAVCVAEANDSPYGSLIALAIGSTGLGLAIGSLVSYFAGKLPVTWLPVLIALVTLYMILEFAVPSVLKSWFGHAVVSALSLITTGALSNLFGWHFPLTVVEWASFMVFVLLVVLETHEAAVAETTTLDNAVDSVLSAILGFVELFR